MDFFSIDNLLTLLMLTMLQAVLGFDNLLYISMESKRVDERDRQRVRRLGIGIAIVLRLVLLFVLTQAIGYFQGSFLDIGEPWVEGSSASPSPLHLKLSGHALIVLLGGGFIVYTAVKEIFHMLAPADIGKHADGAGRRTVTQAVVMIVLMNLVFSFDSILGAIALTKNFAVMAVAVVISGGLMIWLADRVSAFLQKNRMYEVLGLFVLLLVGVMLLSEGGHLAHLTFFGVHKVEAMSKATFYFVLAVLVVVDVVQGRYQKKLLRMKEVSA